MTITLEDFAAMWPTMPEDMRDALIDSTAKQIAEGWSRDVLQEIGCYLGEKAAIPVSLAVRFSGFNEKWIRRNLPIVKAEGQADAITVQDINNAIEKRKDK